MIIRSHLCIERTLCLKKDFFYRFLLSLILKGTWVVGVLSKQGGRTLFWDCRIIKVDYLIVAERRVPAGIDLLKVNNKNSGTRCKICSKLTIKTPERRQLWTCNCRLGLLNGYEKEERGLNSGEESHKVWKKWLCNTWISSHRDYRLSWLNIITDIKRRQCFDYHHKKLLLILKDCLSISWYLVNFC